MLCPAMGTMLDIGTACQTLTPYFVKHCWLCGCDKIHLIQLSLIIPEIKKEEKNNKEKEECCKTEALRLLQCCLSEADSRGLYQPMTSDFSNNQMGEHALLGL